MERSHTTASLRSNELSPVDRASHTPIGPTSAEVVDLGRSVLAQIYRLVASPSDSPRADRLIFAATSVRSDQSSDGLARMTTMPGDGLNFSLAPSLSAVRMAEDHAT
jgi:hypothetical protein